MLHSFQLKDSTLEMNLISSQVANIIIDIDMYKFSLTSLAQVLSFELQASLSPKFHMLDDRDNLILGCQWVPCKVCFWQKANCWSSDTKPRKLSAEFKISWGLLASGHPGN